jgi:DNA-binding transcriptional LysR family regulator
MEMHQIKYFLAVCEHLNFTRAATICGVSQPALSRAIQQLEEELGGLLLRRERGHTHLTDLGHLLRGRLEQVVAEVSVTKREVREFLKMQKASLSLGVMCTVGPARLSGLLQKYRAKHPGVTVKLLEDVPQSLMHRLEGGEIDIALMSCGEPFPDRVRVVPLYRERFVVAFAPGHRFEKSNGISLGMLAGESYLERLHCEYRGHIDSLLEESRIDVSVVYESEREDWTQYLVAAGFGVSLIPEFNVFAPGVITRPVTDPPVTRDIALVSLAGRRLSPAVIAFMQVAKCSNLQCETI